MRRLGVVIVSLLLAGIICLQILAALNIFPRTRVIQVCPVDAISMQNGKAKIDPTKCIGCKRCVLGVPSLIPPKRETAPAADVVPQPAVPSADNDISPLEPVKEADVIEANKAPVKEEISVNKSPNVRLVDSEACIGCQLCVPNCPDNAITMVDGKAVIDPEKCTDCGICELGNKEQGGTFNGCPTSAVSRVKRVEGK